MVDAVGQSTKVCGNKPKERRQPTASVYTVEENDIKRFGARFEK
jgi:hypothetical protein